MYIDLIKELSEDDKKRITNYIQLYGFADFTDVEKWLQSWSHANQKLYRLLGNSFIYKEEISIQKSNDIIEENIRSFIQRSYFTDCIYKFYIMYKSFINLPENESWKTRNSEDSYALCNLLHDMGYSNIWVNNVVDKNIKITGLNKKKTLQIQEGMKPIRALQKILAFIKTDIPDFLDRKDLIVNSIEFDWDEFSKLFDEFRIKLSMIYNDKILKGNLCFSIHPLDFITMSDNSYDWSSCMSWRTDGCYHLGTVEMMNSNNTICCYLEGKEPFFFADSLNQKVVQVIQGDRYDKDLNTWNNKKWRVLVYVNKNIIMSGKAYPFQNEELAKKVIEVLKNLAGSNLKWFYNFGPELYMDMRHIYSNTAMENNRRWIQKGTTIKHNIIWDTRAMYNDMLNDRSCQYWCYRNKVKHNIIYSVSGKAPCLCCGDPVPDWEGDFGDYNERYNNTGDVICSSCIQTKCYCNFCNGSSSSIRHYIVKYPNGRKIRLCENCFRTAYHICPGCGQPYLMNISYSVKHDNYIHYAGIEKKKERFYMDAIAVDPGVTSECQPAPLTNCYATPNTYLVRDQAFNSVPYLERLYMCEDCYKEKFADTVKLEELNIVTRYIHNLKEHCMRPITTRTGEECEKFFFRNQKSLSLIDTVQYFGKEVPAKEPYKINGRTLCGDNEQFLNMLLQ